MAADALAHWSRSSCSSAARASTYGSATPRRPPRARPTTWTSSARSHAPELLPARPAPRERGSSEASDSRVICRWRHQPTAWSGRHATGESVLGFSNPGTSTRSAPQCERELPSGRASAPRPRRASSRRSSPPGTTRQQRHAAQPRPARHLVLLDGREELLAEIADEPPSCADTRARACRGRRAPDFPYLAESAMHGYGPARRRTGERLHAGPRDHRR